MNPDVVAILRLYNPWLENPQRWKTEVDKHLPKFFGFPYILRSVEKLPTWHHSSKVNLVIGPRQSGKSTMIWHALSTMNPSGLIYINGNESVLRQWCSSPAAVWNDLRQIAEKPRVLFFEEVQYVENAALFLKGLVDLGIDAAVFATGSASFHLHDKIRESLAGRAERWLLLPFSLAEWGCGEQPQAPALREIAISEKLKRMLVYGGYPEVCFSEQPEAALNRLVESFVIRDASDVFRIRFPAKFRKLLTLMSTQIGNLVNFSNWASMCGLDVKTVENYADILEESHVIKLVPPYVGGKRSEITSSPKLFFIDNGIRNEVIHQYSDFEMRPDKGPLFENWLFSELYKNKKVADGIHFWRSKSGAEVDFILQHADRIEAFEAKAAALKRPSLSRSARSFIGAYAPEHLYVINLELETEMAIESTKVIWTTPQSFFAPAATLIES
ncbi:MAG: ATP-binding protein [Desulfobacterales bacterium]|nr:ATP-binding protein [Desulfobacterales bacterium]